VYSEPYERKDPSLFPPPPKTKVYEPGTGPALPPRETPFNYKFERVASAAESAKSPTLPPRAGTQSFPAPDAGPPPSLPPRLPPREPQSPTSPSASQGYVNQNAVASLGRSGISVPGFGIGSSDQNNSGSVPPPPTPARGTSWADKKAALKTAGDLKKDPSSVSFTDMRSATATAKNFHERHRERIASGMRAASQVNQKYGITDKMSSFTSSKAGGESPVSKAGVESPVSKAGVESPVYKAGVESPVSKVGDESPISPQSPKKAPPPPPPKKSHLQGSSRQPPPIPFDSKPQG
jgi:hypothetical protein